MCGTAFRFSIKGLDVGMSQGFGGLVINGKRHEQPEITEEYIKIPFAILYKSALREAVGEEFFNSVNRYHLKDVVTGENYGIVQIESADVETNDHIVILTNAVFRRVLYEVGRGQGNPDSNIRQELDPV